MSILTCRSFNPAGGHEADSVSRRERKYSYGSNLWYMVTEWNGPVYSEETKNEVWQTVTLKTETTPFRRDL